MVNSFKSINGLRHASSSQMKSQATQKIVIAASSAHTGLWHYVVVAYNEIYPWVVGIALFAFFTLSIWSIFIEYDKSREKIGKLTRDLDEVKKQSKERIDLLEVYFRRAENENRTLKEELTRYKKLLAQSSALSSTLPLATEPSKAIDQVLGDFGIKAAPKPGEGKGV